MTDWTWEPAPFWREVLTGDLAVQPVRLVLLLLAGPRQGENDFLEFPSIEEAVAFGRELFGEPRFQLDGIEDGKGKQIVLYDHLNELCRSPYSPPERQYG